MQIPIRNIYFMLCYAWNHLDSIKNKSVSSVTADNTADLLARILKECATELNQKGLFRDYIEATEELRGIKGKLQVTPTVQKTLLHLGRAICVTDDYSLNNHLNQIVFSTIFAMTSVKSLNQELKTELRKCAKFFPGVDIISVSPRDFHGVRLSRLNHHYGHILKVCALIWEQLIPDDLNGRYVFEEFDRNERKLRDLFEKFIRNFFKLEKCGYDKVNSELFDWQDLINQNNNNNYFPELKTDTSLRSSTQYTVIETKFIPNVLNIHRDREKFHSDHIKQLMVYLENIRRRDGLSPRGILLYPQVDRKISERYLVWNFEIHIYTLDLMQEWDGIRRDLIHLVKKDFGDEIRSP